jgi:hypothetical protein
VPFTVRVTNLGRRAWGHAASVFRFDGGETEPATRATLVARWVDLGGANALGTPAVAMTMLPAGLKPGGSADVVLQLIAPTTTGDYLLVLDVLDPRTGSLAATGVPPGIIRVTVTG